MIESYIGLDVHKHSVFVTEISEDGSLGDQYRIGNSEDDWNSFRDRYLSPENSVGLEVSTSGKYAARTLMDMGFNVHVMNPSKFPEIFRSVRKNDREDSLRIADLLRTGEIQRKGEIYILMCPT